MERHDVPYIYAGRVSGGEGAEMILVIVNMPTNSRLQWNTNIEIITLFWSAIPLIILHNLIIVHRAVVHVKFSYLSSVDSFYI